MSKGIDWNGARIAFVSGSKSLREVGREFGVSHSTLADRARRERWQQERQTISDIYGQSAARAAERSAETVAELQNQARINCWKAVARLAEVAATGETELRDAGHVRQLIAALAVLSEHEPDNRNGELLAEAKEILFGIAGGID